MARDPAWDGPLETIPTTELRRAADNFGQQTDPHEANSSPENRAGAVKNVKREITPQRSIYQEVIIIIPIRKQTQKALKWDLRRNWKVKTVAHGESRILDKRVRLKADRNMQRTWGGHQWERRDCRYDHRADEKASLWPGKRDRNRRQKERIKYNSADWDDRKRVKSIAYGSWHAKEKSRVNQQKNTYDGQIDRGQVIRINLGIKKS